MRRAILTSMIALGVMLTAARAQSQPFSLAANETVAFLGGANAVALQESGHLETLLTLAFPTQNPRFRYLAWEADTVYAQSRDLNFPPLAQQLRRVGATTIFLFFGQAEALQDPSALPGFKAAYENLLAQFATITTRIVLVTPPAFEAAAPPLPNLSQRNANLQTCVEAIREIARGHPFRCADLFAEFPPNSKQRLTVNGMHWTPAGHAAIALAAMRQLGLSAKVPAAGDASVAGEWPNHSIERVREAVVAKNRLWFNYWRPMNWAFLAGDRTEQPSSRDHRDPKIRWFPGEMEKFLPLIEGAEGRIRELSKSALTK